MAKCLLNKEQDTKGKVKHEIYAKAWKTLDSEHRQLHWEGDVHTTEGKDLRTGELKYRYIMVH